MRRRRRKGAVNHGKKMRYSGLRQGQTLQTARQPHHFSKEGVPMKLAFTTSIAAACLFAAAAFAQGQDFSQVQIKSTPLGNNTYMLEGQGGNMVIAVGGDGVIQVDTEFAPLHDKIKTEIDKLSGGEPIKYVVNTHFHGDHRSEERR